MSEVAVKKQTAEERVVELERRVVNGLADLDEQKMRFEEEKRLFEESKQKLMDAAQVAGVQIIEDEPLKEAEAPPLFDLRTHIRSPKTGRIRAVNHYALWCFKGQDGNTVKVFERPMGSKKFYYENNEPAPQPPTYVAPGTKAPVRRMGA